MDRILTCALLLAAVSPVVGQPPVATPAPPPPPSSDEGLTVRDASVGYIDSAAPANQIRLRADFGYDFRAPNRAELFYPQGRPFGPGLPRAERAVDFQDHTLYHSPRSLRSSSVSPSCARARAVQRVEIWLSRSGVSGADMAATIPDRTPRGK